MSKDPGYADEPKIKREIFKKVTVPPVSEISPRLKKSMEEGALDSAYQVSDYVRKGIEKAILEKTHTVQISMPIRLRDGMPHISEALKNAGYTEIRYSDYDSYMEGEEKLFSLKFVIPLKNV